eukprot:757048-Hanusia_phi.AAC.1
MCPERIGLFLSAREEGEELWEEYQDELIMLEEEKSNIPKQDPSDPKEETRVSSSTGSFFQAPTLFAVPML